MQTHDSKKPGRSWLKSSEASAKARGRPWGFLLPVMLLAPLGLGAKGGCDAAVVGEDCPATAGQNAKCVSAGAGGGNVSGSSNGKGGASAAGAPNATGGALVGSGGRTSGAGGSGTAGGASSSVCGGLLGLSCQTGEYCNYPIAAQCGAADQTGVCSVRPQLCAQIFSPVCGCDGKTYGNACEAAGAGVSVASEGWCASDPGTGKACGNWLADVCEPGEYCQYSPEAMCGRADANGVCTVPLFACTEEFNPVCGCDGVTYGNACTAAAAGMSVDYAGACQTDPGGKACGGLLGVACDKGQYCDYPIEAMCGAADQTGVCTTVPEACDLIYSPVCGCDGKTYGNRCSAALVGVSAVSTGECAKP